jgi:hypothetical protein
MSLSVENRNQLEQSAPPDSAVDLDAIDDTPDAPVQDATTTDVPVNYVSDAELLAWLQAKSNGQYGELDQLMDASNQRSELVKDLSNLREALEKPDLDPAEALEQVAALQAKYAGTQYGEELEAIVAPIREKLESYFVQAAVVDATPSDALPAADVGAGDIVADAEATNDAEIKAAFKTALRDQIAGEVRALTGPIDATIKDLEHDDQIALVQIQALMSEIRETAQLTSNIIANRSQTSDSIVGNIRA